MAPACWLCERGTRQRSNGLCQHFLPWCQTPQLLPVCPFVLPSMLALRASESHESVCGLLRMPGLQHPSVPLSHKFHRLSQPELWGPLFPALEPGLGGLVWGWDPLLLSGDLCSRDVLFPVGPRGAASLVTRARCSRYVSWVGCQVVFNAGCSVL